MCGLLSSSLGFVGISFSRYLRRCPDIEENSDRFGVAKN